MLNTGKDHQIEQENFDRQVKCGSDERYEKDHDVNEKGDVNEKRRDAHSLFKVYNHKTIERPRKELTLRRLEGS